MSTLDERTCIVIAAAKLIQTQIRETDFKTENYPLIHEILKLKEIGF